MSNNLLDGKCAIAISEALLTNRNLLELNLSHNQIGDGGIARVVLPIAKQQLRLMMNIAQNMTFIRI